MLTASPRLDARPRHEVVSRASGSSVLLAMAGLPGGGARPRHGGRYELGAPVDDMGGG